MTRRMSIAVSVAVGVAVAVPAVPVAADSQVSTATAPVVDRIVAQDLRIPWGVAFLPGGDALVSERGSARVVRVSHTGRVTEVGVVPGVAVAGQGGLMSLALSPRFLRDRYVYAFFTAANDARIVRMRFAGGRLGAPEPVLTGIPTGPAHVGGRMTFGPDGMLYAGTGDTGDLTLSQDPNSLGGKILRMTPNGEPARGNPFHGSRVFSLGHRNAQGLAFDSRGRLWASEFGQETWDELNLIRPGGNYGWPVVEGMAGAPGFIDPLVQWTPAEASPSGLAIARDVLYVGTLRGQRMWRVPIRGDVLGTPEAFFVNQFGRLRTVVNAPEGGLWVTTSNQDQLGVPGPGDDRILHVTIR